MKKVLEEIQDGSFAKAWIKENENGRPTFEKRRKEEKNHRIEKVGLDLREKMSWSNEK